MLAIATILLSVSYVVEISIARRRVETETARRLRVLGEVFSNEIENTIRNSQTSRLSSTLAHATADPDIALALLFDVGNRVLVSSDDRLRARLLEDTPFAPLAGQMAAARSQNAPTPAQLGPDEQVLVVPVNLGDERAPSSRGLVVLASNTSHQIAMATAAARRRTAVVTVLLVILTLVAWLLFNRMLLSRMQHLFAAAQRVGKGDFTADFTLPGSDELALLGSALARMTSQLRAHADEIRGSRSALEESHERFAAVARATNDIIWDWDPRTERVWRSDAVKTLLGYDVNQSSERLDWLRHVAPFDHARVEASFRAALASEATSWSCEYQLHCADGTPAYIFDRAIIVRDEAGRPIRMVGAMTDVTAQKRAEESHARVASILQASPDFVGTFDATTLRAMWINKAGRRMVGLADDEDVSELTIHDFQPTWVLESLLDEMISVAKLGGVWAGETGMRHREGHEITVLKTVVAHRRSDGQAEYISAVARDIRERKHLEAQLLHAQKLESIGRLAGGVAHDFNNMLTAIIGYTELAKAQLPDEHPVQADLDNVNDAARRSAALTRQLLAFARKQVITPRAVDLNDLIARIDTMLNRLLGEDIRLDMKLQEGLAPVSIDPGQFEQVLMNLAVNARDAMPHGGTLSIETADVSLDDVWCQQHPGATPGEYGLVRVGDTGVGMSRDVMARLFEPFFTTKPSGEGTGLGLAMCYGIVKQSGGTIWVSSEPGRGTTFDIYLPRHRGAASADETGRTSASRGEKHRT
jgi:PAS domain S-box-containing protein